ncbi:hypothetical protein PCH_Pc14g01870 [Penicillium rubens Wisconsin 54-1255]|uniref:Uncharacterized protein n=1 Tax=Penicillium rubens (strain ATCC 28089 / DSM 1075 / NRRL 1951 / Wisconsin 54-1255) TaxID=500485 RepID=B6H615_PENRW|nr:hypothetical protein PCH_Pc14g01870 [Penicillium rubens Wisconsin 54-1255]
MTMPPLPNPPTLASDEKRTCPGTTANILVTILEALCRFYIRNVPQSVLHKKEPTETEQKEERVNNPLAKRDIVLDAFNPITLVRTKRGENVASQGAIGVGVLLGTFCFLLLCIPTSFNGLCSN